MTIPSIPLVLTVAVTVAAVISPATAQADACGAADPSRFIGAPFNTSTFSCKPVWNTFILRYSQSKDNVVTVILSAVYTNGWVGIGFSKDGMMVGSSAMVGWIGNTGRLHIKQFYLRGQSSSQVVANEGQLKGTEVPPRVVLLGPNIYLAFQLKFSEPVTQQNLVFAFGLATPVDNVLKEHADKTSVSFDFSSGITSASSYPYKLKRTHGALAIFGWGVLLPIGAIIARYCKQWDPVWLYSHAVVQFVGFLIGFAALVAGFSLYDKLHANVQAHRGLGIFIFVLGILQVIAFFVRPDKDSKIRRYWNWYHHWAGRLVLFLAAVNIIYGIHVGGAGKSWKVGYGIDLAFILIVTIVLEVLLWARWSTKSVPSPTF